MGEVYRATDTKLGRLVAIKLLPQSAAQDNEARRRLLQEARSAAALNHPNIVTIYSVDESEAGDLIVMELVEGETLQERTRDGALNMSDAVDMGIQVADALGAAHAVGLIHRDIKPANIKITKQGVAKVLDFGVAKQTAPALGDAEAQDRGATQQTAPAPGEAASDNTIAHFTSPGLLVGTFAYMSPEQTRGEPLDGRSDVFALGSTLYEALTGRQAFTGESALETMHDVATKDPTPPSLIRPELPSVIDLILARALAKSRDERYQSARDLADALRELREGGDHLSATVVLPTQLSERGPNNLPSQLTSFIGRRRERVEVRRLLHSARMVTLTGPGGSGKTRLAIQIAADVLAEYPAGAWLAEFEALTDPALVPQTLASILGVQEESGRSLLATLSEHLAVKQVLLLLDNCEHLAAAVASLAEGLLRACPKLRILATSRESLGLRGEIVWRIPVLSVPDIRTSAAKTKESAGRYEAVRLFVDRAIAAQPSFALTDKNAMGIAQICNRLDGIPLAIELAAVRVKALPVEKILARLEDRFHLLTGGSRTAIPRQQTLRAAVDWSYELLAPKEKLALNRASVFMGGFSLEAAETVCAGEDLADAEILDLVTALADKSLVVRDEVEEGDARYRLLETIRAYATEKLAATSETATLAARHGSYFLEFTETAEPELRGPDQAAWLNRIEREHDNLRLASRGFVGRGEPDFALRLAGALWRFYWVRGLWQEGRMRLDEALTVQGAADRTAARAKALNGAAAIARGQGDFAAAQSIWEESLRIARDLGLKPAIADALFGLGNVANSEEDLVTARRLYEESLALRREIGDRRGASFVLHNLGVVAHAMGDAGGARTMYEEALVLHRQIGNSYSEAASLNGLGDVALYQGDLAAAREYQERGLAIQRELGDKRGIAFSLRLLGRIAAREGDLATARSHLIDSVELLREMGDKEGLTDALESVAEMAALSGDAARALRLAGAAAASREAIIVPLSRPDQEQLERSLVVARRSLGAETAERVFSKGHELSLEEAVGDAMRGLGE